jgi:hypothetical protein
MTHQSNEPAQEPLGTSLPFKGKEQVTFDELLVVLEAETERRPGFSRKDVTDFMSRFRTLGKYIRECLKRPNGEDVMVGELIDIDAKLLAHLTTKLKEKHVNTQMSRKRSLVAHARRLGWSPPGVFRLDEEWDAINSKVSWAVGARSLIAKAKSAGYGPSDLTDEFIEGWAQILKDDKDRGEVYVDQITTSFYGRIMRAGLESEFRLLDFEANSRGFYRLQISRMPPELGSEIQGIIDWAKKNAFVSDEYLKNLQEKFERFVGYVYWTMKREGVEGFEGIKLFEDIKLFEEIKSVKTIFTKSVVSRFMAWQSDDKGSLRPAISQSVSLIRDVLTKHPDFKDINYEWTWTLIKDFPKEGENQGEDEEETSVESRRNKTYVPHFTLATIPKAIRAEAAGKSHLSQEELAWYKHDELLMALLVTHPWQSKAICACSIDPDSANVFRDLVPDDPSFALTPWASKAKKVNRDVKLWQFYFSPEQTRNKTMVWGLIPRILVPLLVEYLKVRKHLTKKGEDPGTLFLSRRTGALDHLKLGSLVKLLSKNYIHKSASLRSIRYSFACMWLESYENGRDDLAQIMWTTRKQVDQMFPIRSEPSFQKGRKPRKYERPKG